MGQAAGALHALSCDSAFKYWLNAMHCSSDCCGGWTSCTYSTDKVDVAPDSDSDFEMEMEGCCAIRKGKTNAAGEAA